MATAVDREDKQVEPFTEQEPFLWDSHRYYGYIAGVGSGKTAVGVMRDALNMERWNVGELGAIVAPSTQMIKNAILPIMRDFGLFERWEYNSPQSEEPGIISPNGSRAVILSADNERQIERLAGLNLAWWHLDENKDINPRARQILIQRLRTGDYPNGYVTTTPKGYNHDYDFFVGDVETEQYNHGKATVYEGRDRLAITAVPTDANPHLRQEDTQAIRDAHPDGLLQQEVEGRFVEIGAGIFKRDMLTFTHPESITTNQLKTIIAVDPAATVDAQKAEATDSDYWACTVVQAYPRKNKIYVTETVRRRGMTLAQGCEWVASIANQARGASVVAEANQAQRWLIEELKNYGVYAEPVTSTRNKESRLLDLSIPLENGTIEFVDWNAETEGDVGKDHPYQELVGELLAFPEGNHDDLIDSLHRAVDFAPVNLGTTILGSNPYASDDE